MTGDAGTCRSMVKPARRQSAWSRHRDREGRVCSECRQAPLNVQLTVSASKQPLDLPWRQLAREPEGGSGRVSLKIAAVLNEGNGGYLPLQDLYEPVTLSAVTSENGPLWNHLVPSQSTSWVVGVGAHGFLCGRQCPKLFKVHVITAGSMLF